MMLVDAPLQIPTLEQILPDEPLLMMGAGPVPIPPQVARANSVVINHLGDTMSRLIEHIRRMAGYVFQTQAQHVLGVAGPGSAAMEMAICNLVGPGSRVLSVCNGYFSRRMAEMAERVGAEVDLLVIPTQEAAQVDVVKDALHRKKYDVLTIVQGETSNTVCNHHLREIATVSKEMGCLVIVDAVCTLSTMPLEMDLWGIDATITGGQKGLSSIPGVSLIAFSNQAWQRIEQRTSPITHWCLDAQLADKFWYKKSYHYTAPVSGILALYEALRLVCQETLPCRFERHRVSSVALQGGIEAMGLELFVAPESRLNSVVGICVPDKVDGDVLRKHMSDVYKVEISGSFGHNLVRIGQMGEQCRAHNLFRTMHALGASAKHAGVPVDLPGGIAELGRILVSHDAGGSVSV